MTANHTSSAWIYYDNSRQPDREERILRECCHHYGYHVSVVTDRKDLILHAAKNKANFLALYSIDSLKQITDDYIQFMQELEQAGVEIYLVKEGQYIGRRNKLINLIQNTLTA